MSIQVGLYNQLLTNHGWCQSGDNNPLFVQATQFVTFFLPCFHVMKLDAILHICNF